METEVENAPNAPKEMVDGLKQTASKLNSDIQELIREIDDSVTEKEMFRNFNYWCLLSSFVFYYDVKLNGLILILIHRIKPKGSSFWIFCYTPCSLDN